MPDELCPVCGTKFSGDSAYCPQCERPRSGVAPKYLSVPWQRAAAYLGAVFVPLLIVLLLVFGSDRRSNDLAKSPGSGKAASSGAEDTESARKEGAGSDKSKKAETGGLQVLSWHCTLDQPYVKVEGEVKNVSGASIDSLRVTATARTEDGKFVTAGDGPVDYEPLLSGQTSPFKAYVRFNPAIRSINLGFETDRTTMDFSGTHSMKCEPEPAQTF